MGVPSVTHHAGVFAALQLPGTQHVVGDILRVGTDAVIITQELEIYTLEVVWIHDYRPQRNMAVLNTSGLRPSSLSPLAPDLDSEVPDPEAPKPQVPPPLDPEVPAPSSPRSWSQSPPRCLDPMQHIHWNGLMLPQPEA